MFLLCAPLFASLGGNVDSVVADQVVMKAKRAVSASNLFTIHELRAPTGVSVREYVSADGKVFAVAWNGPWKPDLHQLLGNYFGEYQQAAASSRVLGRAPRAVRSQNVVVEASGHMRSFSGRAFLPQALPAGFSVQSIR